MYYFQFASNSPLIGNIYYFAESRLFSLPEQKTNTELFCIFFLLLLLLMTERMPKDLL